MAPNSILPPYDGLCNVYAIHALSCQNNSEPIVREELFAKPNSSSLNANNVVAIRHFLYYIKTARCLSRVCPPKELGGPE